MLILVFQKYSKRSRGGVLVQIGRCRKSLEWTCFIPQIDESLKIIDLIAN